MKLAAIAKIVKETKTCKLYRVHSPEDTETDLFISTGFEIYSLTGFPKPQSDAELATLLGITQKQWNDVYYSEEHCNTAEFLDGMNLEDACWGEVQCQTHSIGLQVNGDLLLPLVEPRMREVGYIEVGMLAPIADEIRKSSYIEYCLRKAASGKKYYVIKDGMIVRAAIMPVTLMKQTKASLETLTAMTLDTTIIENREDEETTND